MRDAVVASGTPATFRQATGGSEASSPLSAATAVRCTAFSSARSCPPNRAQSQDRSCQASWACAISSCAFCANTALS